MGGMPKRVGGERGMSEAFEIPAGGTNVRSVIFFLVLDVAIGQRPAGYPWTEPMPGDTKSPESTRAVPPPGARGYLKSEISMLVRFVGPDTISASSFFDLRDLGTGRLNEPWGTGGTKVRRVPAA